jgi:hypothetical protein
MRPFLLFLRLSDSFLSVMDIFSGFWFQQTELLLLANQFRPVNAAENI